MHILRLLASLNLGLVIAVVSQARVPVAGPTSLVTFVEAAEGTQAPPLTTPARADTWTPPRTPWGDPDLQGIWTGSTLTPVERPREFAGKAFLTEEEAAALEARAAENRVDRPPRAGDPGTYNQVWFDPGTKVVPSRRSSLVVDPPDGRIPYLPEARKRDDAQAEFRVGGARDSWLDVDTGERCLGDGLPMIWLGYNPNHHILQTPGYVVILHEMFRERRIIPLDGRPHGNIGQWHGDMRGHWEGNTLVVDTTNFIDRMRYRWAALWRAPSETMHMVERFTRIDAATIDYQVTIEDPAKFTKPWTLALPLTTDQAARGVTEGRLYEYACHEGNYSIVNVLSGARAQEKSRPSEARAPREGT